MTNVHATGLSALFGQNIVTVYFVYGLSFFFVAIAIVSGIKSLRSIGLADPFLYLLAFSLTHGSAEWIDTYRQYMLLVHGTGINQALAQLRIYLVAISFFLLFLSGFKLICRTVVREPDTRKATYALTVLFVAVCVVIAFRESVGTGVEIMARYLLGVPATVLMGVALLRVSRKQYPVALPKDHSRYFMISGFLFFLYGLFAGVVGPAGDFFPASYVNQNLFAASTGVPVQGVRAVAAIAISYCMVRAMAMSISLRLLNTFAAFIALLFIYGLAGYMNLQLIVRSYADVVKLTAEEKDVSSLYRAFTRLNAYIHSPVAGSAAMSGPALEQYKRDFEALLGNLMSMKHENKEEVEAIKEIAALYRQSFKDGARPKANLATLQKLKLLIKKIDDMHADESEDQKWLASMQVTEFKRTILATLAVSLLGAILIWYSFYRFMILPLRGLGDEAHQIMEGDLTQVISTNTADELQAFAGDFDAMRRKLLERTAALEARTSELKELSIRDGLTGLFNHRHFYEALDEEMARARRYGTGLLSVIILDVDDFKHYNDTNGHTRGDALLRDLSKILWESFRDIDAVCRYGGEEFAVVMPETSLQSAITAAERVRRRIEYQEFYNRESQPLGKITISVGVASYPWKCSDSDTLIKLADDALYRAKREGKNRVAVG